MASRRDRRGKPLAYTPSRSAVASPSRPRTDEQRGDAKVVIYRKMASNQRRTVMRKLIYSMTMSLDGYIAGPDGAIDWTVPDEELFLFHTQQIRETGVHLCGRRLYTSGGCSSARSYSAAARPTSRPWRKGSTSS
jgi:hypothetical protein